jgi:hypothetical protein
VSLEREEVPRVSASNGPTPGSASSRRVEKSLTLVRQPPVGLEQAFAEDATEVAPEGRAVPTASAVCAVDDERVCIDESVNGREQGSPPSTIRRRIATPQGGDVRSRVGRLPRFTPTSPDVIKTVRRRVTLLRAARLRG